MEFIWVILYCLTHLVTQSVAPLAKNGRLLSTVAVLLYTGALFLWLLLSGKAKKIRLCPIRPKKKTALLIIPFLLLFPVYNCLTSAYLEINPLAVLLIFCICAAEEIFFRGFLLQQTKQYGAKASVMISSCIFALYHLVNYISEPNWIFIGIQILSAFAAGLCYAVSCILLNSIWPCIFAHFLTNLTAGPSPVPEEQSNLLYLCIGLSFLSYVCFYKSIGKHSCNKGE